MAAWEQWAYEHVDVRALYDKNEPPSRRPPEFPERNCVGCSEGFIPAHGAQIWCKPACRDKSAMRRKREKMRRETGNDGS